MQIISFVFHILRILEDCPQLIVLLFFVVILYQTEGYYCIDKIYNQRIENLGDWSNTEIQSLRARADLTKSTTSLLFDKENTNITLSALISILNIFIFTILGANKALKLRTPELRRKYFLMAVPFSIFCFPKNEDFH